MAKRAALIARTAHARVVLLDAPSGSGKTMLAELLAAAWGGPVTRVVLRAGDDRAAARHRIDRAVDAQSTTVMIDDLHQVVAEERAAVIEDAADRADAARLIVAGRGIGLRDLERRGDVVRLGSSDLAFTADDIGDLLGDDATPSLVAEIAQATDGWAAAVAATIERIRADPRWSPAGATGARSVLADLLGALVAEDPALPLLVRLPLLDDPLLHAVGALVGRRGSSPLDVPTRPSGRWSRLAPSIAAALRSTAPLPGDVTVAAARHYVAHGEVAVAVELLLAEGGADDAARVVADVPWPVLADLDPLQLRLVVAHLTPAGGPTAARALLNAARAAEQNDSTSRGEWLAAAIDLTPENGTELRRAVDAEMSRFRVRSGDVERGAALATATLAVTPAVERTTRARALTARAIGDIVECTPASLDRAAAQLREAASLFAADGEHRWRAETLARLGYSVLYVGGDPIGAVTAMDEALALLPVGDLTRAFWLANYADLLEFVGREADAEAAVREAIEIGTRRGDAAAVGMAWWSRSWLAAHRGDRDGVRAALAATERRHEEWLGSGLAVEYFASSAEQLLLVDDLEGYHDYIARAEQAAQATAYPEPVEIARTWHDAVHGDAAAALHLLNGAGGRAVTRFSRPRRLLLAAIAHLRLGERDAAETVAGEAFADAAAMGVPDLHERYNRSLLARLAPVLDARPAHRAGRLQLLGGFGLAVDGADRTPPPGHAATLVKLLAVRGEMTVEAIVDTLWPDSDLTVGRTRLRNLLNRLKERSGEAVTRSGEILRLAPDLAVDADDFERAATAALTAPPDERVGRARQAIALYTGELLPNDVYDDWAAGPRTRLQRRLLALADLVAADAEARGDLEEAIVLLDIGIAAEPLDEARTLRLCELLDRQSRGSAAATAARRCRQLLDELGVAPTAALVSYAER